jgi:hypothetical protein
VSGRPAWEDRGAPSAPVEGGLWLGAFPRGWDAAHERTVRGHVPTVVYYPGARRDGGSDGVWLRIMPHGAEPWTGVFASDNLPGRLNVVASWPDPHQLFVAAGGSPYLVDARDPDAWSRIDRPGARHLEPVGERALLLDVRVLAAYDADGLAWESDDIVGAQWLGILDDEVHLRAGGVLHRVSLRHGRTVSEPASW